MTEPAQKIALFSSFDGSTRNKLADPLPHQRRELSARKKAEIADRVERELAEAEEHRRQKQRDAKKREMLRKAEADSRERRGLTRRLPTGFGTPEYKEALARHKAHRAKMDAEAEARRERTRRPELTEEQLAAVERQVKIARGAELDGYGDPID